MSGAHVGNPACCRCWSSARALSGAHPDAIHSWRVRDPLLVLQGRQAATRLSGVVGPPLLCGMTWSAVVACWWQ